MAKKRARRKPSDAPEDVPEETTEEPASPKPIGAREVLCGPPGDPAPPPVESTTGDWVVIAINKRKFGDVHRVLRVDWRLDTDVTPACVRFETRGDAQRFIDEDLIKFDSQRPLCFYRFTPFNMGD